MNWKQILVMISACIVSALIVWHDLPIEFPMMIFKGLMLFLKLFTVLALTTFAYILAGPKK
ncbi:MAG: hypothetical protein MUD15_07875 [Desulfobacterota bacterium]|jgi:hypothetical protein|nr:hypothetical protein [Thermodesulfobacteriota bacterium]